MQTKAIKSRKCGGCAADKIVAGPTAPYKAHAIGRSLGVELDSDDAINDIALNFFLSTVLFYDFNHEESSFIVLAGFRPGNRLH